MSGHSRLAFILAGALACRVETTQSTPPTTRSPTATATTAVRLNIVPQFGHPYGPLSATLVLPDRRVVTGAPDGSLILWSEGGGVLIRLGVHRSAADQLAVGASGRFLVSGSLSCGRDSVARVWDLQDHSLIHELDTRGYGIRALAISESASAIATLGTRQDAPTRPFHGCMATEPIPYNRARILIWNLETGALRHTIDSDERLESLEFRRNGDELVGDTSDGEVIAWETASGKFLRQGPSEAKVGNEVRAPLFLPLDADATFSIPHGSLLWSSTPTFSLVFKGRLHLYDATGRSASRTHLTRDWWDEVSTIDVKLAPDGRTFVLCDTVFSRDEDFAPFYDAAHGHRIGQVSRPKPGLFTTLSYDDSSSFLVTWSGEPSISAWRVRDGAHVETVHPTEGGFRLGRELLWTQDAKRVLQWNLADGSHTVVPEITDVDEILVAPAHGFAVWSGPRPAFLVGEQRVLFKDDEGWALMDRSDNRRIPLPWIDDIARVFQNGAVVPRVGGLETLWEVETRRQIAPSFIDGHHFLTTWIASVERAEVPAGPMLVVTGIEPEYGVLLWRIQDGRTLHLLAPLGRLVAISDDGRLGATPEALVDLHFRRDGTLVLGHTLTPDTTAEILIADFVTPGGAL